MSSDDLNTDDAYLWTGEGDSEEVKALEAVFAPIRHARVGPTGLSRSWLRALLLGVCASLAFFAIFSADRAPARLVGLFHDGPVSALSMYGGARVSLSVNDGMADRELSRRVGQVMSDRGAGIVFAGDAQVVLELPEYDVAAADAWASRIAAQGNFSLHKVLEDSPLMKTAYGLAKEELGGGVGFDIDSWYNDELGRSYSDYYLTGDLQSMQEAFERWRVSGELVIPEGTLIAFEKLEVGNWRSYYIDSHKELSRADIADTSVYWNPTTNHPEILIAFSEEGGRRFADLTREILGRKVAMVLDGEVLMAPSVQAVIEGGSTSISLGENKMATAQAEAEAFAGALRGPALPGQVSVQSIEAVERSVSDFEMLAARALMALSAGLCIFLVAWPLGFLSRKNNMYVAPLRGGKRHVGQVLRPLAVTLASVAAVVLLSRQALPGSEAFLFASVEGYGMDAMPSWTSVGILPFLVGAVLAEALAWLVPGWRRRRGGDKATRAPIGNLALLLGLLLLAVQAHFLATWLSRLADPALAMGSLSSAGLEDSAFDYRVALFAIIAGSALLYGLAKLVDRFGIGNGLTVILGAGVLPLAPRLFETLVALSAFDAYGFFETFMLIAAVIVSTAFLMRRTMKVGKSLELSLASAGIAPALVAPVALGLFLSLARGPGDESNLLLATKSPTYLLLQLMGVLAFALVLSLVSARLPKADGESRIVAGVPAPWRSWRLVLVFASSVAFPLFVVFADRTLTEWWVSPLVPVVFFALGTAAVWDLAGEVRARWNNPELVSVFELQRPRYLLPVLGALQHAGIDVFVRGRYLRAMLSVLGPFVPMEIMVPAHRASEARGLIQSQL